MTTRSPATERWPGFFVITRPSPLLALMRKRP